MRGSPFFEGVAQAALEIEAGSFQVPCFYYDSSELVASFPARLGELRRLLPPGFEPARLAPGVGLVEVGCLEHRDSDAGPYREAIVAAVLNDPQARANVPGRIVRTVVGHRPLHLFVLHLPVTTELARAAGVDFYGYAKFLADVELVQEDERLVARLA